MTTARDFLTTPLGTGWHLDRRRFEVFAGEPSFELSTVVEAFRGFDRFEGSGSRRALTSLTLKMRGLS